MDGVLVGGREGKTSEPFSKVHVRRAHPTPFFQPRSKPDRKFQKVSEKFRDM